MSTWLRSPAALSAYPHFIPTDDPGSKDEKAKWSFHPHRLGLAKLPSTPSRPGSAR